MQENDKNIESFDLEENSEVAENERIDTDELTNPSESEENNLENSASSKYDIEEKLKKTLNIKSILVSTIV